MMATTRMTTRTKMLKQETGEMVSIYIYLWSICGVWVDCIYGQSMVVLRCPNCTNLDETPSCSAIMCAVALTAEHLAG